MLASASGSVWFGGAPQGGDEVVVGERGEVLGDERGRPVVIAGHEQADDLEALPVDEREGFVVGHGVHDATPC
jgi:hypothetical protein